MPQATPDHLGNISRTGNLNAKILGIELDKSRNAKTAAVISKNSSRLTVRVIRTDEERMIAKMVYGLLERGWEKHIWIGFKGSH